MAIRTLGKPVTLRPVRPNEGLEADFRRRLDKIITEMHASLTYWLKAAYRANEPEIAADVSPAVAMRNAFRRLARRWQRRFDDLAPDLARYFATAVKDRSDAVLKGALAKAGFTVPFKMTATMNDAMQATIGEQVGLIRSIASQHLSQVETMVMQSVARGRDLGGLATELEARFQVTKKRAALIAKDQNNKATATVTRVRQMDLGLTEALWIHSTAGKHPRPSHVAANGKSYDIKKGMLLDGEWLLPGQAINCRCISRPVIPGFTI